MQQRKKDRRNIDAATEEGQKEYRCSNRRRTEGI